MKEGKEVNARGPGKLLSKCPTQTCMFSGLFTDPVLLAPVCNSSSLVAVELFQGKMETHNEFKYMRDAVSC